MGRRPHGATLLPALSFKHVNSINRAFGSVARRWRRLLLQPTPLIRRATIPEQRSDLEVGADALGQSAITGVPRWTFAGKADERYFDAVRYHREVRLADMVLL